MSNAHIVLLNGASSSGKTSIAHALCEHRDAPYFYVAVDHFNAMRPGWGTGAEAMREGVAMNAALHQAVATIVSSGWPVILDHVLVNPNYLHDCVQRLRGLPVLFVGVHCPLDLLIKRERERGDRQIGIAADQYERAHQHGVYDLEIDTSRHDPYACAEIIRQRLAKEQPFLAFAELARSLEYGPAAPTPV